MDRRLIGTCHAYANSRGWRSLHMRMSLYGPGSISLALLLPLCLWSIKERLNHRVENAVSLVFPAEAGNPSYGPVDGVVHERYARRLYHCIGSVSEPGMSSEVREAIHDLVRRKDHTHGVYLTMNDRTIYGDVMATVDHCLHTDTVAFAIHPEGIWIWYSAR
jgi:hypothetical protein